MRKNIIGLICLTLLFSLNLIGQIEGIEYDDVVYDEAIHSTTFHLTGFPLTQPIIDLESSATFTLTFDDFAEDLRDMYYTIIHCNQDWTPSDLSELEYLDGFDEDQIDRYEFSDNTLKEFTNYRLEIPNDRMSWTKSGNYILAIYLNDDEKEPLLTRRFMVVDPMVRINPTMVRPANVQKAKTHQELDFSVFFEGVKVRDARREITATILQNGRWDNAITQVPPYSDFNDKVIYDYQDRIVFPAGKEFRFLDIRSFRYRNEGVAAIEEYEDIYEITLFPGPVRTFNPYLFFKDINGNFFIENIHEERADYNLRSDYGLVLFSLEKNMPFPDADVYLYGKMTDWKIQEKYKLAYSEKLGLYAVDVLLKQGYYNYNYAVVPFGTKEVDLAELEGNFFEAENEYTIFIYHRPFGGRYDQLVGAVTIQSNI